MNGFGDEGGRAIVQALRQNNIMKEIDLGANRMTDSVIKLLGSSLDAVTNLEEIHVSSIGNFSQQPSGVDSTFKHLSTPHTRLETEADMF